MKHIRISIALGFSLSVATLGCEKRSYNGSVKEASVSSSRGEVRNGWLVNPTPGNWWLVDKDGSWVIATQGRSSAPGFEKSTNALNQAEWTITNVGDHGFGCASIDANFSNQVDNGWGKVVSINSWKWIPKEKCDKENAIKKYSAPTGSEQKFCGWLVEDNANVRSLSDRWTKWYIEDGQKGGVAQATRLTSKGSVGSASCVCVNATGSKANSRAKSYLLNSTNLIKQDDTACQKDRFVPPLSAILGLNESTQSGD